MSSSIAELLVFLRVIAIYHYAGMANVERKNWDISQSWGYIPKAFGD